MVDWSELEHYEEFNSGDKYYAFGFGSVGFFGGNWNYLYADNIMEALAKLRKYFPDEQISIRSAFFGEWKCNNFNLGGHIQH